MGHNYWACALEPGNHNYWAPVSQLLNSVPLSLLAPQQKKPLQVSLRTALKRSPCSPQPETSPHSDKGPVRPIIIIKKMTELKKTKLQLHTSTLPSVTDKSSRQKASENRGGWRPSTDQTDIYITFHTTMAVLHSLLNYPQNTRKPN